MTEVARHDQSALIQRDPLGILQLSLLALPVAIAYSLLGIWTLRAAHPQEDAFILFKYVNNLSAGNGIVYFVGGPRAEGATDFLWMLLLAAIRHLDVSAPVAAVVLNSAGAWISAIIFLRVLSESTGGLSLHWPLAVMVLPLLLVIGGAAASYVGFSSMLYCALALCAFYVFTRSSESSRSLRSLPFWCLTLALFRPDGVVIATPLAIFGLIMSWRSSDHRIYLIESGLCAAVGAGYFIWRWRYFGHLLPLPLYVKSHSDQVLPSLASLRHWISRAVPGFFILAALSLLALPRKLCRQIVLAMIPFALHLFFLSAGILSQNIGSRFQSPVILPLVFVICLGAAILRSRCKHSWVYLLLAPLLLGSAFHEVKEVRDTLKSATNIQYTDSFAYGLAGITTTKTKIALTEAGRIAYWTDAQVTDLVGLNTADTALHPPNIEFIESIDPDVVMFHIADMLDLSSLNLSPQNPVVEIELPLSEFVVPSARKYLGIFIQSYRETDLDHPKMASVKAAEFLARHRDEYRVFAVYYWNGPNHVYGLKRQWPNSDKLVALLRKTQSGHGVGYWEMLRSAR